MTISFYIMSKVFTDEVKRAVDNVYSYVDEIIVVLHDDTNAQKKARSYDPNDKIKIYQKKFTYFADMRNHALNHTTGDWITWLDSDEIFSPFFLQNIKALANQSKYDGYKIHRLHFYKTKYEVEDPFSHLRLFKKKKGLRYVGMVHELLTGLRCIKLLKSRKYEVWHFNNYKYMKANNQKYRAILEKELEFARKLNDRKLIELAKFRIWSNRNIDCVDYFYNPAKMKEVQKEFKQRLKEVLGDKKHYHNLLVKLEKAHEMSS
ncbi:MAG: glycosyltransferase [Candidatus Paceibacterota bacterium]